MLTETDGQRTDRRTAGRTTADIMPPPPVVGGSIDMCLWRSKREERTIPQCPWV